MAIVKLSKMRLIGLLSEQDKILDTLYSEGIAHIVKVNPIEGTTIEEEKSMSAELMAKIAGIKSSIEVLETVSPEKQEVIEMKSRDFLKLGEKSDVFEKTSEKINSIKTQIFGNYNQIIHLREEQSRMVPVELRSIGPQKLVPSIKKESERSENTRLILEKIYQGIEDYNETDDDEIFMVKNGKSLFQVIVSSESFEEIKNELENIKKLLTVRHQRMGKIKISYSIDDEEFSKIENINKQISELYRHNLQYTKELLHLSKKSKDLKKYYDFLQYSLERNDVNSSVCKTGKTFVLDFFVPRSKVKILSDRMMGEFPAINLEIVEKQRGENPPTLVKKNALTRQSSFITNMYSVPHYNEIDPNVSLFFFFMVFFGFIMADIGYGIVLMIAGYVLASRIKEQSGAKRLWQLIGTAGIFAIIWGFLFGSFFGFTHANWWIIPESIMPDPRSNPILLLLFCLLMGVIQIAFGYILRGLNAIRRGNVVGGIVNGFMWTIFLIAFVFAVAKFLLGYFSIEVSAKISLFLGSVQKPALIVALTSFAIAILFAGVGERGFKIFSKSFGSLYGIITLFSDILSYARLFGLMLSGYIIAEQFNQIGLSVMNSPIGYIFGAFIILIGHVFNIAMGALSAYIHDVRLQYIEYFTKFYTGEGSEFVPFGSTLNYITITDKVTL